MSHNPNEVFASGATTSQHIDAQDDDHFENTTFKLKRTRSMGLLDEFIQPLEAADGEAPGDGDAAGAAAQPAETSAEAPPKPEAPKSDSEPDEPPYRSPDIVPHDDTDIAVEPSLHVDYFSHQWDVADISRSWRYIIQKRKDVANSARLENASWRTWAQRRSGLKTINPELLNWSKESDITWLYGPIVKDDLDSDDEDDHKTQTVATSKVAGDISLPSKSNKGILKHRTVEDKMISHANLLKLQLMEQRLKDKKAQQQQHKTQTHRRQPSSEPPEFDDYDAISQLLNTQYKVSSNPNSSTNLAQLSAVPQQPPEVAEETMSDGSSIRKETRHIHFNEEVQQCIALEPQSDKEEDDYDFYDQDYDHQSYIYTNPHDSLPSEDNSSDDDDEDDDGGFFLQVRSPSATGPALVKKPQEKADPEPSFPSHTDDSDSLSISTDNSKTYRTIQLLPSTSLNYGSDEETSDEENPYTSSLSHNVHNSSSRGYDYMYDYNTVYTVDPKNNNYKAVETADVVDVPEDIADLSNYQTVDDSDNMPIIDPSVISGSNVNYNHKPEPVDTADPSDSDTDSDDEGLSIATRTSSQQLAQSIYNNLTPAESQHHYPEAPQDPHPVEQSIASINPRHSSTGLSKQSTSSNSLSDQFFGTTPLKKDTSNASLADQFFNCNITPVDKSLGGAQPKASAVPPQTTSANAFSGNGTPPLETTPRKTSTFAFDSSDSEDDSENDSSKNYTSYNSLSQVAGKNGIGSPPEDKNLVYQAKDLANHFLGNWNHKD